MYFSVLASKDTKKHGIGVATSKSVKGPYTPKDESLACPLDQGGSIDAAGFQDDDGTRYFLYKVDGNSLGNDHPTSIMLQQLASDGITTKGDAKKLLDKGKGDGPLIEAPSLVKEGDTYYLTFSSNIFNTRLYDTSYATAKMVTGPYTKVTSNALLLTSGMGSDVGKLAGPGGSDFTEDGSKIVFLALRNGQNATAGRAMYVSGVDLSGVRLSLISGIHSYLCILWVLSEFSGYTNLCQSTVYARTK